MEATEIGLEDLPPDVRKQVLDFPANMAEKALGELLHNLTNAMRAGVIQPDVTQVLLSSIAAFADTAGVNMRKGLEFHHFMDTLDVRIQEEHLKNCPACRAAAEEQGTSFEVPKHLH